MLITCKNIRYVREAAGLSQEEFGKPFNLNRGNVSSYEEGSLPKDPGILVKIANYFGVDLQKFLTQDLSKSGVAIEVPAKIYIEDRVSVIENHIKALIAVEASRLNDNQKEAKRIMELMKKENPELFNVSSVFNSEEAQAKKK